MINILYLADRKSTMSSEDFVRRWKEHGALAMQSPGFFSGVSEYIQSDGLSDLGNFPGVLDYDALGELIYDSVESCRISMTSSVLANVITPDGDTTFDKRRWLCIASDELILRDGAGPIKLIALSTSGNDKPTTGQADALRDHYRSSLLECESIASSAVGISVGFPADTGLPLTPFQSLVQLTFASAEKAATAYPALRDVCQQKLPANAGQLNTIFVVARSRFLLRRSASKR